MPTDLEKLMNHLTGPGFQGTFFSWCTERCDRFSGYEPGQEHKLIWSEMHKDFSALFDELMDEFLHDESWEKAYVVELAMIRNMVRLLF
jgi:hypothetical protein